MPTLAEQAASLFQLTLTPQQAAQFDSYAAQLAEWNERVNLTAIVAPEAVQLRHFLDSLSVVRAIQPFTGMRVVDVGTGAGFPGLPLKIVFPDTVLTLMEATGKKITFLNHIIQSLGLKHTTTLHARAEEAGQMRGQRAAYDLVVARSVARLPALLEYMLPLARIGGMCVAMKGETAAEETADSKRALTLLGGKLVDIITVQLPGLDAPHYLIRVEKIAPTPSAYPRKPGTPTRQPLA